MIVLNQEEGCQTMIEEQLLIHAGRACADKTMDAKIVEDVKRLMSDLVKGKNVSVYTKIDRKQWCYENC